MPILSFFDIRYVRDAKGNLNEVVLFCAILTFVLSIVLPIMFYITVWQKNGYRPINILILGFLLTGMCSCNSPTSIVVKKISKNEELMMMARIYIITGKNDLLIAKRCHDIEKDSLAGTYFFAAEYNMGQADSLLNVVESKFVH